MNKSLLAAAAAATTLVTTAAWSAVDVGVGVTIREPGVYGRIEIGSAPPPPVLYPQPVLIRPVPVVAAPPPPLYLYVPPGHAKNWGKYCYRYNACARPVYFVQETWVEDRWEREHPGKGHGKGKSRGKGKHDD
ncbi:MAG: hypothetical protein OEU94_16275 [Aquincola sp.]|nr:hypothetical protein [Aquincola sp.]MDH4287645.1 hypothetical protein [Aquincola sp.]MDH5329473.1 hypothetical protein [Aquincola sp.]